MDPQHESKPEESDKRGKNKILNEVVFSPEAEEVYEYLKKKAPSSKIERTILKAVDQKIEIIKSNRHYGRPMPSNRIPVEYRLKYGVENLFKIKLPNFWRMLYYLTEGESRLYVIAFVVDIIDHRQYDRKFKGRGR